MRKRLLLIVFAVFVLLAVFLPLTVPSDVYNVEQCVAESYGDQQFGEGKRLFLKLFYSREISAVKAELFRTDSQLKKANRELLRHIEKADLASNDKEERIHRFLASKLQRKIDEFNSSKEKLLNDLINCACKIQELSDFESG